MSGTTTDLPLQIVLHRRVMERTARQVRDLEVEFDREEVVLRGRAESYYVKQLAQHGVRDVLPNVALRNAIEVR